MKRLHVINLEKMGGAESVFIEYINNPSSTGDAVFCISHQVAKEISERLPNTKITYVNRVFSGFSLKYPAFLRKWVLSFKIAAARPDVVIFWDLTPRHFKKSAARCALYYDHGASWRFPANAQNLAYFAQIDGAIAVSKASLRILQQRFNLTCPIEVVPNRLAKSRQPIAPKKAPGPDAVTLGTASRLVSLKGIGVAVMAVAELRQRGVNARLKIAGKGPNEEALRTLVRSLQLEEFIEFCGFQRDLTAFYRQIDIYMSMSVSESFGLSCADALSHGVPCVYSLIDGQAEVIRNGLHGIGITPDLDIEEYEARAGYQVEKPYFSYDPVSDTLVEPKMVDPVVCADKIEELLDKERYHNLTDQIRIQHQHADVLLPVTDRINAFLTKMIRR